MLFINESARLNFLLENALRVISGKNYANKGSNIYIYIYLRNKKLTLVMPSKKGGLLM